MSRKYLSSRIRGLGLIFRNVYYWVQYDKQSVVPARGNLQQASQEFCTIIVSATKLLASLLKIPLAGTTDCLSILNP